MLNHYIKQIIFKGCIFYIRVTVAMHSGSCSLVRMFTFDLILTQICDCLQSVCFTSAIVQLLPVCTILQV